MELFAVERYDENVSIKAADDPEKEDEILQKLLKKVEKRKRKLKTKCNIGETNELQTEDQASEANEAKKRKSEIETTILSTGENVQAESMEEQNLPKVSDDDDKNFQILGTDAFEKLSKIEMVLPPWLAYPVIISRPLRDDNKRQNIEHLSFINHQLKANLKSMNIEKLFPVQETVIPWILDGHNKPPPFRPRDICVSAPTGSGKTLAFAIPIVQLLDTFYFERKIRALIVLPVNELALQVFKVFKKLIAHTKLNVCLLSKATAFISEQKQLIESTGETYRSKVDIVITTPGRLVEHLHSTKGFCLKSLKFLVIDEADRIMDQIYHNWLYHMDEHVKKTSDSFLAGRSVPLCYNDLLNVSSKLPHKMLFSATLSQDPEKLQHLRLFQPKLFTSVIENRAQIIDKLSDTLLLNSLKSVQDHNSQIRGEFVGKYTTPAELTEKFCLTDKRLKPLTLYCLINANNWKKFLCFTNNNEGAHRLSFVLSAMFPKTVVIKELSSGLKAGARKNIIEQFSKGKIFGLVCSDTLARGMDIPDIDIVISYDAPRHVKTYIHRVGRTARAGRPGTAITLLSIDEKEKFDSVLSEAGKDGIDEIKVNTDAEEINARKYSKAISALQKAIESEKKTINVRKREARSRAANTLSTPLGDTAMDKLQAQVFENIAENEVKSKFSSEQNQKRKQAKKLRKLKHKEALVASKKNVAKKNVDK